MGLFDTIKVSFDLARLPNKPSWLTQEYSDKTWWQSKDIEAEMGTFEIRSDLTLWRLTGPWHDGEHIDDPTAILGFRIERRKMEAEFMSDFTDFVNFYCGFDIPEPEPKERGARRRMPWYEVRMLFRNGKCTEEPIFVRAQADWETIHEV